MSNYPTNLTEKQWQVIKNNVEPQERSRKKSLRETVNGIFYINKSGCQWRMLPSDFAPWQTTYYYFRKWKLEGVWEELLNVLHAKVRKSKFGHYRLPKRQDFPSCRCGQRYRRKQESQG